MAHEIYNDTAYAGTEAAWHGLGTVLPEAKTMTELAQAAGLDRIEYSKTPLFFEVETLTDTFHHQFPGRNAMLVNGLKPIAVVGDEYEWHQPYELYGSIDRLITAGGWKPETALALGQAETTSYCTNLGGWSMTGNDRVIDRLLITDTVDGRHALTIAIVPTRVVCANTLRLALNRASVRVNLVHKAGHKVDYNRAVDAIIKAQNNVREALTDLSRIPFTKDKMLAVYAELFNEKGDDSAVGVALVRRMGELQQTAAGFAMRMVKDQGLPFDGWAVFNGASEAVEHGAIMPKLSTKIGLMLGRGKPNEYVSRAYELVLRSK